jgi:hypothetical protein
MLIFLEKPEQSIKNVISIFNEASTPIRTQKNKRININSDEFILMVSAGEIIINAYGLCSVLRSPLIFGLSGCFGIKDSLQFRATTNTVAHFIKTKTAVSLCQKHEAWKDIAEIICYNNSLLRILNDDLRNAEKSTGYRIFRAVENIYHLQENQGRKLLLAKEIMALTLLSRSIVMKKILLLKNKNIIQTTRGVLTFIDLEKLRKALLDV